MYRTERQPAWQRDITWASGVLLALTVLAGVLLFTQMQLASPDRGTAIIRGVLELTLQPGGEATAGLGVRAGSSYQAGQPLMLLPGVDVYADATEIPGFTAEAAVSRTAGVLTGRLVDGGGPSLLAAVTDPVLSGQLRTALDGPIAAMMRSALESELLPAGLDDGSRLADWPAQAAANPGTLVQPIVGVFVYESPNRLATMGLRAIGVSVVGQLSDTVMAEGLNSALALVTNANLQARLQDGAGVDARASIHQLLVAILAGRSDEMAARLAEANAVLAGEQTEDDTLAGLLPASQLAGLSPEQANEAVLDALAQRAYQGGGDLAAAQMTRPEQAARLRGVAPLIDGYSAAAQGRYRTWTVASGVLALVFLVLVVGFSRGLTRVSNPGIAIALGAAAGAILFEVARRNLPVETTLPAGAQVQGVFAALAGLISYAATVLPNDMVSLGRTNHIAVLIFGGALVVLALVMWLLRGVRPRRRSF
jgi:hypothetical protein